MGFGSYDESEQQDTTIETDDSEAVNLHQNDHDGSIEYESEASTDELLDRLADIKDDE